VANILISIGILEKVKSNDMKSDKNKRKNAYKWIGSEGFNLIDNSLQS